LVAITASVNVRDHDEVVATGSDGYIGKPIPLETLVADVESYLHRKA
jgi:DNA-binding response OmpR family regulator